MKPGGRDFGKQDDTHKGFEHTWRVSRIDINRPVVLQGFAFAISSLNALKKPSILQIAEDTVFVFVECHVAVELVHSVDRLLLQDAATILVFKIPRQVFKRCKMRRQIQRSVTYAPQPLGTG
jgi:hypothetical protein